MTPPIAIFYHCLFHHGTPPVYCNKAFHVVGEQMALLSQSGLLAEASHFVVGINGGPESMPYANLVLPLDAERVFHGLQSKSENLTLVELEKWLPEHPGWNVLYFHAKAATHPDLPAPTYNDIWRQCMMEHLVRFWPRCVADLNSGAHTVGCHWMDGLMDGTQHYWAGNFWWATSDYLRTLPSIFARDRIKVSGIDSLESRYEAEVWIGNGALRPKIVDYHPIKTPDKVAIAHWPSPGNH